MNQKMISEKQLVSFIEELLKQEPKKDIKSANNHEQVDRHFDTPSNGSSLSCETFGSKSPETREELADGLVWVKDGQIVVEAQPGKHSLPSIKPDGGLELFINGELIRDETIVSSDDCIQVNLKTFETPLQFQIKTSKDGLKAIMSVKLQTINRYHLKDQSPCKHLVLRTELETKRVFPLNFEEIIQALNEKGIFYGVDYAAIQSFLADPRDGDYHVATGIPPKDPVDDFVAILFDEQITTKPLAEKDTIDFYSLKKIPSVEKGTLLAVKTNGKAGQPGLSVTGETLVPREPRRIFVKAGKGAQINNNAVYATKSGRPMVKKWVAPGSFSLSPIL